MQQDFPNLLSPLSVGPREIRNRVLVTGHVPGLERNGYVSDEFIAYHVARARGGAGLQMTGSSGIHETGVLGGGRGLDLTKPGVEEGCSKLADAIRAEGGTMLVQLGHSAASTDYSAAGRPLWGPSPVPSQILRQVPHQMSVDEIEEIIEAYARAAARVCDAGMDGVEILAAFGYLPGAFLSPLTNTRDDQYGGPLSGRSRFALEVAAAVRRAVGTGCIVGMRISGDEKVEGGLHNAEICEAAAALAAAGHLDYLNVSAGTNYDRIMRNEHWGASPSPHGEFVPYAAAIKRQVDLPVFVTGRITDPRMAEKVLRDGKADMVGMTRAHISDPDIVAKILRGEADDIRPCVGANVCIARGAQGKPLRCFHNALAGREYAAADAAPAKSPKSVAVIGGGPAGLEAARVAAQRGHRVTLYEASDALGGQLGTWSRAPFAREFSKTLAWYEKQLSRHQVRVVTGKALESEEIAGLDAEVLILATGSKAAKRKPYPGEESSAIDVSDPDEVLASPPEAVEHAVVSDEGFGRNGLAAAELLAEAGIKVTLVTSESAIAELLDGSIRTQLYRYLLERGVTFRPMERVVELGKNTVVSRNIYSGERHQITDVDLLVDWRGNRVNDTLLEAARASGKAVHVIGDCLAPRTVQVAIAEAEKAARQI